MTEVVAALDGGGTRTRVAMALRDGTVEFFPELGGCNPTDNPRWKETLEQALAPLVAERGTLARICLGLPGFGEIPAQDTRIRAALKQLDLPPARLRNDVEIAHIGAFAGGPGVLVLAGTGSMALERHKGSFSRRGGWGHVIGDEGSAWWIGREALALAARMLDGREERTGFLGRMLGVLDTEADAREMAPLSWLSRQEHQRSAVAGLALHVDRFAQEGDANAAAILKAAAGELARHVTRPVADEWSHAGSVFHSRILREEMARLLGKPPQAPVLPPLGGGLLDAACDAGWAPGRAWIAKLARGLRKAASQGNSRKDKA